MKQYQMISVSVVILAMATASCRTLATGGKIVDKSRNEVVISSPGNQQTAIPDGSKDTSITSAREKLEVIVKERPRDIQAILSLAQLQLAQDRFADAEATSRSALMIDIRNQEAHKVLAQIAIRTHNYDKALIFLTSLGGESSSDSSVHNMLGLIALANGDNGEAMRIWKRSLNLNASDISVRMNMGVLYLKYRLLAQARSQFERILKVAPSHQDAKLHLAIIDASRGKNAEAIVTYQEILSSDSTNQLALYNMAIAQKNSNLLDESIATLKAYIKASPQKTEKTDHAFALIEDINGMKTARGEKASDEDLRALADELGTRQPSRSSDKSKGPVAALESPVAAPAAASSPGPQKLKAVAVSPKKVSPVAVPVKPEVAKQTTPTDAEMDELEKQLKAPAH